MISVGSNKAHWKLSVTKSAKSSSSKSSSVGRILMRNEVGQEATEEMSAFKSVVNLFIIVLHYMSLHNNMLSKRSDEEGEVSQSREVLADCGKAYGGYEDNRESRHSGDIKNNEIIFLKKEKHCCTKYICWRFFVVCALFPDAQMNLEKWFRVRTGCM